jgi:hypothetical protein
LFTARAHPNRDKGDKKAVDRHSSRCCWGRQQQAGGEEKAHRGSDQGRRAPLPFLKGTIPRNGCAGQTQGPEWDSLLMRRLSWSGSHTLLHRRTGLGQVLLLSSTMAEGRECCHGSGPEVPDSFKRHHPYAVSTTDDMLDLNESFNLHSSL